MTELTQATEESCRGDQTGPSFLIAKYTERQTTLVTMRIYRKVFE